jgi:hypothetical protein
VGRGLIAIEILIWWNDLLYFAVMSTHASMKKSGIRDYQDLLAVLQAMGEEERKNSTR